MINVGFSFLKDDICEDDIKKESALIPQFLSEMNTDYLNEISGRKHLTSAYQSIVALRLLGTLIGKESRPLVLARNDMGRPFIVNIKDFDFNISHSKSLVVCAACFSENCTPVIGIDAEDIYKKDPMPMAKRFFADGELALLEDSEDRQYTFTDIWTKKEAYLKYMGSGITTALSSIDTTRDLEVKFETARLKDTLITVCSKSDLFPLNFIQF